MGERTKGRMEAEKGVMSQINRATTSGSSAPFDGDDTQSTGLILSSNIRPVFIRVSGGETRESRNVSR